MDAIDTTIVATLAADGRATLARLSEATGLSTSAVQSRVQRLERDGVVLGYRAVVDLAAVDRGTTAFVQISPLDPAAPDDAPARLEHISEIEACYSVAGDASYILLVRVPQPRDLESLLQRIRVSAQVATRTTVVLHSYFEHRPPALGPAAG